MQLIRTEHSSKDTLRQLMSLFLHDLSEFDSGTEMNQSNGLFEFDAFDLFFEKEGLDPYFIAHENNIIGFVLLQSGPYANPDQYDYLINSFFILKKYRRKGLGKQATQELFKQHPGRYAIGQLSNNIPAIQFWRNIYNSGNIEFYEKEVLDEGLTIIYQFIEV